MPTLLDQNRGTPRGSSLLPALIIISILSVVVVGIVRLGSTENDAVGAKRRFDHSIACADAARDLLMSQFHTYGMSPTQVTLSQAVGDQTMSTGHYDSLNVTSVVAATGYAAGVGGTSDISNRIARAGLGGQVYRMTVVCSRTGIGAATQQSEVEFVVRFGL